MGANEDHLKKILEAERFRIDELRALKLAMTELETSMNTLMTPEWRGTAADEAVALFTTLTDSFKQTADLVADIDDIIVKANTKLSAAEDRMADLPPGDVDPVWKKLAGEGQPFVYKIWTLPAATGLSFIEDQMAAEREEKAGDILDSVRDDMTAAANKLRDARSSYKPPVITIQEPPPIDHSNDVPTYAPKYPNGTTGGNGSDGHYVRPVRPDWVDEPKEPPVIIKHPPRFPEPPIVIECEIPNIDDEVIGTNPNPNPNPNPTGNPGPIGGGNNGTLPGLLGGGAGAAAIGVGAKLAGSGMGGLGGGALGGGGRGMGSGGLLGGAGGAGANGATSAGARGGAGAGAGGAGGRGNTAMMGGGSSGSASDKEKRSGLGGIIAPRLDDEDDASPRSAGAGAGGRDQPAE